MILHTHTTHVTRLCTPWGRPTVTDSKGHFSNIYAWNLLTTRKKWLDMITLLTRSWANWRWVSRSWNFNTNRFHIFQPNVKIASRTFQSVYALAVCQAGRSFSFSFCWFACRQGSWKRIHETHTYSLALVHIRQILRLSLHSPDYLPHWQLGK